MSQNDELTLADLISPGLIQLDLTAKDKWGVIEELASLLEQEGKLISRSLFLKAVAEREAQISTSVGFGVAIPHGKSESVGKTSVALGRSLNGIRWDPEEPDSCHLILLLAVSSTEPDKAYLKLLATLARSLLDEEFRDDLINAPDSHTIMRKMRKVGLDRQPVLTD